MKKTGLVIFLIILCIKVTYAQLEPVLLAGKTKREIIKHFGCDRPDTLTYFIFFQETRVFHYRGIDIISMLWDTEAGETNEEILDHVCAEQELWADESDNLVLEQLMISWGFKKAGMAGGEDSFEMRTRSGLFKVTKEYFDEKMNSPKKERALLYTISFYDGRR